MNEGLEQVVEDAIGEVADKEEVEKGQEVEQNNEPELEVNPDVQKAMEGGWRPKDDWKGDPDDFVSAKKFNERGEMMDSISTLRKKLSSQGNDFDKRIASLTKLQEARTKQAITDLQDKRDQAVDLADRDAVNKIQVQIDDLSVQPEVEEVKDNRVLATWNIDNPWINDESPKSAYAFQQYGKYCKAGNDDAEAIRLMEADILKAYPPTNSRRDNAPSVEGGRSNPGKRVERKLAWDELTRDEVNIFNSMPGVWKRDEYLQAVIDDRKGGAK